MKESTPRYVKDLAKKMRKQPTETEALLWERLRRKGLGGYKFYRQYPIGRYVADFCCPEKNLIVELDGRIHESERNIAYDEIRDKTIFHEGFLVIRFRNEQVITYVDEVLGEISDALAQPFPSHKMGEGQGERVDMGNKKSNE